MSHVGINGNQAVACMDGRVCAEYTHSVQA